MVLGKFIVISRAVAMLLELLTIPLQLTVFLVILLNVHQLTVTPSNKPMRFFFLVSYCLTFIVMCEFLLPSFRCAVTGDCCRQFSGMRYLECAARELGFTLYDYSRFSSFVTGSPYPRPSPAEFDFERDVYLVCPF